MKRAVVALALFTLIISSSLALAAPTKVLILKNEDPWGSTVVEDILRNMGISYDVMNSDQFNQTSLDYLLQNYYMIIIESDQDQRFYDTIVQEREKLEEFVIYGRVLEIHACDFGRNLGVWRGPLPGGLVVVRRFSYYDYDLVNQRWLYSTYASHGYFTNVPDGAEILTVQSTDPESPAQPDLNKPTTVKFRFGRGIIFATMEAYEHAATYGSDKQEWENILKTTISSNIHEWENILKTLTTTITTTTTLTTTTTTTLTTTITTTTTLTTTTTTTMYSTTTVTPTTTVTETRTSWTIIPTTVTYTKSQSPIPGGVIILSAIFVTLLAWRFRR